MDNPNLETLGKALGDRYLTYALSTIMNRALPDARDGLKPVHRRIIYAMRMLKLTPKASFRKCAKIVGEVMGNYHPHGDKAIYDALSRLAQDFSLRYPLIEGQGNFGNIDGDNPAAQRYTEARLSEISELMLDALTENAVDFRDNYDGSETEPIVLPAGFPQLLANGSSGIAVGMATNVPPHNLHELCEALFCLIENPDVQEDLLLSKLHGPDFPTGGVLVESQETIFKAYKTGRGSLRLRADYHVEMLERGVWQAVVTEIPYQVQKSKLVEKIADLINEKKLPITSDIRDESDEVLRLIIEPRSKAVDPKIMMETLFKMTDLEIRFALNMNVLIDGLTPKVCSVKELLEAFLSHRRSILLRRSEYRLNKIDDRLEVVEGYITVFLNLDRVIEIIRYNEFPKESLIAEFTLSDTQAEAILNMKLRSLRKLEETELKRERDDLTSERQNIEDLIDEPRLQWLKIRKQLIEVQKKFGNSSNGGKRRTKIQDFPNVDLVPLEAFIEKEPITIVCSEMGWIRAMRGQIDLDTDLKYRDGDSKKFIFHGTTTDKIILTAHNGRCYTIRCDSLPGGRGMGEPIRISIDLPNEVEIVDVRLYEATSKLLFISSSANGFVAKQSDLIAQTRGGKQILNLAKDEKLQICVEAFGDHIVSVGQNRKLLIFPIAELPEMAKGKGVRIQKFKNSRISDVKTINIAEGLSWNDPAGRLRSIHDLKEWFGKRASQGKWAPRGFPKGNKF